MSTKKITDKLEDLDDRLDGIEIILVKQEQNLIRNTESLMVHMKRSEMLEDIIEYMKENEIKPLNKFKDRSEGALKLIGVVALLTTIAAGLIGIFKHLF
jgi:replicative superfamily II helicase